VPLFFGLPGNPQAALVVGKRSGGGNRQDAHINGRRCRFSMFVYAHINLPYP
jgi:hypothetical protein